MCSASPQVDAHLLCSPRLINTWQVTDVCGEKRFVSTVARRLRSLGALSVRPSRPIPTHPRHIPPHLAICRLRMAVTLEHVATQGDGGGISEGKWSEVLTSLETDQGSEALTHMCAAHGCLLSHTLQPKCYPPQPSPHQAVT